MNWLQHDNHPDIVHKVWEEPQEGCFYSLGHDPAGASTKGHPAATHIWCDRPRKLVCEMRGHTDEREWARQIYTFARWYNWAYINIEVYRYGNTIKDALIYSNPTLGINETYPNIYRMPTLTNLKNGKHTPSGSNMWMYEARAGLREYVIDAAVEAEYYAFDSNEADVIPDEEFLTEMDSMFRSIKSFRREAGPGATDDRIIATGLCWLIFKQEPFDYSTDVTQERSFAGIDENGNVYIDIQAEYEASNFMPNKDEIIYG